MVANKKMDSRPVKVSAVFTSHVKSPVHRRRYEAISSTDPVVIAKVMLLEQHILTMPDAPLQIEPASHRQTMAEYVLEGFSDIFPPARLIKKKECMSDAAFKIVQERAVVSRARNAMADKLAAPICMFCFLFPEVLLYVGTEGLGGAA